MLVPLQTLVSVERPNLNPASDTSWVDGGYLLVIVSHLSTKVYKEGQKVPSIWKKKGMEAQAPLALQGDWGYGLCPGCTGL